MHCVGGQRGGRHRSVVGVGFLRLSHPHLVSIIFSAPSLLQMKFFQKLFPLCFCSFGGGGCKPKGVDKLVKLGGLKLINYS